MITIQFDVLAYACAIARIDQKRLNNYVSVDYKKTFDSTLSTMNNELNVDPVNLDLAFICICNLVKEMFCIMKQQILNLSTGLLINLISLEEFSLQIVLPF